MSFEDEWITYTFWLGWITAADNDKKSDKSESTNADAILYEPIEKEKKKDPQPIYDPGDEIGYYE